MNKLPLVVTSRIKQFNKEAAAMNTSEEVINSLSVIVRDILTAAQASAKADQRKTVMARDISLLN